MVTVELGRRIQELLDQRGISRKEFAAMTGLTEAAISRYITGKREPKAATLSLIADALGVSMDDLLGTPCDDPNKLDGAVRMVARSIDGISEEQKRLLVDALLNLKR